MTAHRIFMLVLILSPAFFVSATKCVKEGSSQSQSLKIKSKILCNYDKEYRPVFNQKQAVNVSIRLILKYLDSISSEDKRMDIQNWLGISWIDEFLVWNPAEYKSVKNVHVPSSDIWTPDIKIFKNGKNEGTIFDSADCLVQYNGIVSCVLENEHEAQCTESVLHWPQDLRTCEIIYTTGVYNSSEIKLLKKPKQLVLRSLEQNPEWKLINASNEIKFYKSFGQIYQHLSYSFTIQKHSTRTISVILIPAISLITMTLVPLWMKPGNNERFCLIAANVLSHFLFLQHLTWLAPSKGNLPPAVTFFRDSLGLAIAVLVEMTLIKSLLSNRATSPTWMLNPCKFIAKGIFGKGMLIEEIQQEVNDEEESVQTVKKDTKIEKIYGERCLIVTVIDRLLFVVLTLVYFILVMYLIPFN